MKIPRRRILKVWETTLLIKNNKNYTVWFEKTCAQGVVQEHALFYHSLSGKSGVICFQQQSKGLVFPTKN